MHFRAGYFWNVAVWGRAHTMLLLPTLPLGSITQGWLWSWGRAGHLLPLCEAAAVRQRSGDGYFRDITSL